jgi:lipopolysaccharide export system permease protein
MRILTRYILRAHLGPFVFALSVLTGMLYINVVARRLPDWPGTVTGGNLGEGHLLSLPHIVALTLPMAVLVAVRTPTARWRRTTVTALKASGINLLACSCRCCARAPCSPCS